MSVTTTDMQPETVARTYSLPEIATFLCGAAGPAEIHWVTLRLRGAAEPKLNGYKVQRRWRMTQADLDAAVDQLRPRSATTRHSALPEQPPMRSMTSRSQRRLVI